MSAAEAAARQKDFDAAADRVMVRATPEDQADPWRMRELKAQAEREGKQLVLMHKPTFFSDQIADALARRAAAIEAGEMKTISRTISAGSAEMRLQ